MKMKTKHVMWLALISLVVTPLTLPQLATASEKKGSEVTLKGEVLDLYCYMKHPETATGSEHEKCATSCINRGLPIGFLSDGVVYVVIGSDHESASGMVADFTGKPSELKGVLIEHDGIKSIEVVSIKAVE